MKRIFKDNKGKMFIYLKKSFDKRKVVLKIPETKATVIK